MRALPDDQCGTVVAEACGIEASDSHAGAFVLGWDDFAGCAFDVVVGDEDIGRHVWELAEYADLVAERGFAVLGHAFDEGLVHERGVERGEVEAGPPFTDAWLAVGVVEVAFASGGVADEEHAGVGLGESGFGNDKDGLVHAGGFVHDVEGVCGADALQGFGLVGASGASDGETGLWFAGMYDGLVEDDEFLAELAWKALVPLGDFRPEHVMELAGGGGGTGDLAVLVKEHEPEDDPSGNSGLADAVSGACGDMGAGVPYGFEEFVLLGGGLDADAEEEADEFTGVGVRLHQVVRFEILPGHAFVTAP